MANTQVSSLNFQFTKQGQDLSTQAIAGKTTIEFTKAQASSDVHYADTADKIATMTALGNVKQEVPITEVDAISDDQSTVKIPVVFEKSKIDADYQLQTIGLFAKPKDGQEVLYAVLGLQDPVYMHKTSNQSIYSIDMYVVVGTSSNVTLKVDPAGAVSNAQLTAVLKDYALKSYVDDAIKNNKVVLPDNLVKSEDTANWQKTKVTNDDGTPLVSVAKGADIKAALTPFVAKQGTGFITIANGATGNTSGTDLMGSFYSNGTTLMATLASGFNDSWILKYTGTSLTIVKQAPAGDLNSKANNTNVVHRDPNTGKATDKTDWDPNNLTVANQPVVPMVMVADEATAKSKSATDPNTMYCYPES